MIHVYLFNNNGRKIWVPAHDMFPFVGIEDFREKANNMADEMKKANPTFATAFVVKPQIYEGWQLAVAEAMDVLYDLDLSPLKIFEEQVNDAPSTMSDSTSNINRKRKRKDNKETSVSKVNDISFIVSC